MNETYDSQSKITTVYDWLPLNPFIQFLLTKRGDKSIWQKVLWQGKMLLYEYEIFSISYKACMFVGASRLKIKVELKSYKKKFNFTLKFNYP